MSGGAPLRAPFRLRGLERGNRAIMPGYRNRLEEVGGTPTEDCAAGCAARSRGRIGRDLETRPTATG